MDLRPYHPKSCVVCGKPYATPNFRCEDHRDVYLSAGPVIEAFHASTKFVKGIMGPFGSAKSTACCYDLFFNAMRQPRQTHGQYKGKRLVRYAVARNTYRELEDTTIPTFLDWFGDFGEMKVSDSTFWLEYEDILAEYRFRALDKPEDIKKLLSAEYTKGWLNEAREAPWKIVKALGDRTGRYPDKSVVEPGLVLDTNPPDEDHWWFDLFEKKIHEDPQVAELYEVFKQPPGAVLVDGRWEDNWGQVAGTPKAENIENLVEGYYQRLCVGVDEEYRKVYALGQYGFVQDGKPVYSQYVDALHCVEFRADPDLPLMLGFDAGLTPACVIGQVSKRGQLRILDEIVTTDMDMYNMIRDVLKPHLAKYYRGYKFNDVAWADPAKTRGDADKHSAIGMLNDAYSPGGEEEHIDIMVRPLELPFMTVPAPGDNSIAPRLSAVNFFLTKLIDGAPGLLIHPRCTYLRKGFMGKYRFERVQVSGEERYKEIPKKNIYSHVNDSLQNLALGAMGEFDLELPEPEPMPIGKPSFSGRHAYS